MRTEFDANEMNVRVRRNAETGEPTTATVSFTDENGNTLVARLKADTMLEATRRFTQENLKDAAIALGPSTLAFQEAVGAATEGVASAANDYLTNVARSLGITPADLARAARNLSDSLNDEADEEPETTEEQAEETRALAEDVNDGEEEDPDEPLHRATAMDIVS